MSNIDERNGKRFDPNALLRKNESCRRGGGVGECITLRQNKLRPAVESKHPTHKKAIYPPEFGRPSRTVNHRKMF